MAQSFQPRQTYFPCPGFQLMHMPAVELLFSTEEHWPGLPSAVPAVESSSQSPPDHSSNLFNPKPWQDLVHTNCRQLAQARTRLPKLVGPTQEFKDSLDSSAGPASITRCPQHDRLKVYAKPLNSGNSNAEGRALSVSKYFLFSSALFSATLSQVSQDVWAVWMLTHGHADMGRLSLIWASLIP